MSLDAFSRFQMRLAAGLCPDSLGELKRSPRPPSRNQGRGQKNGKKGGKREGRDGEGLPPPYFTSGYGILFVVRKVLSENVNRKYHTAHRFVPFPVTLNDLEGHSPVAGLIERNSTNICATFRTVSTDTARRAVPRR